MFEEGGVVLASSANITVHLPVPSSAGASTNLPTSIVTSGRGLTFLGYLPMTKLSARLEASGKWTSVEGVTFQGHVSTDVAAASLSAVLPSNLPLGPSITVNGTVVVQGADPYLVQDLGLPLPALASSTSLAHSSFLALLPSFAC